MVRNPDFGSGINILDPQHWWKGITIFGYLIFDIFDIMVARTK